MKPFWPFGIVVGIRNANGFIEERRIWKADVPILNDALQVAQPEPVVNEDKEKIASLIQQLGQARARLIAAQSQLTASENAAELRELAES